MPIQRYKTDKTIEIRGQSYPVMMSVSPLCLHVDISGTEITGKTWEELTALAGEAVASTLRWVGCWNGRLDIEGWDDAPDIFTAYLTKEDTPVHVWDTEIAATFPVHLMDRVKDLHKSTIQILEYELAEVRERGLVNFAQKLHSLIQEDALKGQS